MAVTWELVGNTNTDPPTLDLLNWNWRRDQWSLIHPSFQVILVPVEVLDLLIALGNVIELSGAGFSEHLL